MKWYSLVLILLLIPMSAAFAENGDCWFIFCLFEKWTAPKQEMTVEELYVEQAEKGKQAGIKKINEKLSDLKEYEKTVSDMERQTGVEITDIHKAVNQDIELYEGILYAEEDRQKNPAKYYTKQDLVNLAMEFYKNKPDGTSCDEDRRWVEKSNACVRQETAHKTYYYYDLEWLRYR